MLVEDIDELNENLEDILHEVELEAAKIGEGKTHFSLLDKIVDGKRLGGGDAEIEAILSSGDDGFRSTSYANLMGIQSNLFGTKEYADENNFESKEMYGGNTYSNYLGWRYFENQLVWNDGSTFNWTFSVESQTDTTATLHFVNNAAIEG